MKLDEIKKQYPQEWVLIEYDELDDDFHVKEGRVLAHSSNKDEVYKALGKTFGKNVSVEYLGPVPNDLTVMFFVT